MRGLVFHMVLLVAANSMAADRFLPAIRIEASAEPIDVGRFRGATPFCGDIDGDGLKDLLVGGDEHGRLRIYRNGGTDKQPKYDTFDWLRVNDEIAELPGSGVFQPQLADLDSDGQTDIVTVASSSGLIFWYRRKDRENFADAEILKLANRKPLMVGLFAACHVVDWDEDGDHDLLIAGRNVGGEVGEPLTELQWVENRGTPKQMSLAEPVSVQANGHAIRFSGYIFPFVIDWNGDGKKDLLLGLSNGEVLLYENGGERHELQLIKSQIIVAAPVRGLEPPLPVVPTRGRSSGICVVDWNNDGRLDLLIGDSQTETVRVDPADSAQQLEVARLEVSQMVSKFRQMRRIRQKVDSETKVKEKMLLDKGREAAARRLEELQERIAALEGQVRPHQVAHGYVWLLRHANHDDSERDR